MAGYIKIPRDAFSDPAFTAVRFPRPWAWIDLIQMARYKRGEEFVNGRYITLERGQLCKSVRELAHRWGWDEKTVCRYIECLQKGGLIAYPLPQSKGGLTRIISIVNYDSFCDDSHSDSHTDSHSDSGETPTPVLSSTNVESKTIVIQERKEIKEKKNLEAQVAEAAERLYRLYPTKCPVSGRATGKSSSDKKRIVKLLGSFSEDNIAYRIRRYVKESLDGQTYIKNFSTFLNNPPDYPREYEEGDTEPELFIGSRSKRKPQEA